MHQCTKLVQKKKQTWYRKAGIVRGTIEKSPILLSQYLEN